MNRVATTARPCPRATLESLVLLGLLALTAPAASAQWTFGLESTISLEGALVTPRAVVSELGGTHWIRALDDLPIEAGLRAVEESQDATLFAVGLSIALPGGLVAERRDVIRLDGGGYSLAFDGSLAGIPADVAIDAISVDSNGDLLLSFDASIALGALLVDDADLVAWDGSIFSLFFDASAASVPATLGVDGAHYLVAEDALALSFDAAGSIGGIPFGRQDILRFARGAGTWTLARDLVASDPAFATTDLVAVPEPAFSPALVGLALTLVVAGGRIRR